MTVPYESVSAVRQRAFVALGIALVIGVAAWLLVRRATESGLARMAAIERAHALCDSALAQARNHEDSLRVGRMALADTIDPRSDDAMRTCGDVRR